MRLNIDIKLTLVIVIIPIPLYIVEFNTFNLYTLNSYIHFISLPGNMQEDPERVIFSLYDSSTGKASKIIAIDHAPLPSLELLLTNQYPSELIHPRLSTAQWLQEIIDALGDGVRCSMTFISFQILRCQFQ